MTSWRQKSPRDRNSIQTSNIANSTASNDGVNDTKWSPLSSLSLIFDTQEPLGFQEKLAILLFQELLLTIKKKDGQLSIELDGTTKRYLTNSAYINGSFISIPRCTAYFSNPSDLIPVDSWATLN